jgi:phosphoribosyl 1,2-cyclic phosphate phosphodiesterase
LPVYGNAQTLYHLNKNFSYIFGKADQVGGGIPQLVPKELENKTYLFGDIPVTPLDIQHGKLIINGFRFKDCAYITDCSGIPNTTQEKLKGLKVLILNALGFKPHPTHFNLTQALEAAETLKPERTILTHINHHFDFEKVSRDLPEGVELALDGMQIEI